VPRWQVIAVPNFDLDALALRHDTFWTLKQLEIRLAIFYEKYNNSRVHSAVAMLPPQLFWEAWGKGKITARKNKRGKLIFKLTVPRYLLTRTLKLEAEAPANEQANTMPVVVLCWNCWKARSYRGLRRFEVLDLRGKGR
jgi:hypothetical protein